MNQRPMAKLTKILALLLMFGCMPSIAAILPMDRHALLRNTVLTDTVSKIKRHSLSDVRSEAPGGAATKCKVTLDVKYDEAAGEEVASVYAMPTVDSESAISYMGELISDKWQFFLPEGDYDFIVIGLDEVQDYILMIKEGIGISGTKLIELEADLQDATESTEISMTDKNGKPMTFKGDDWNTKRMEANLGISTGNKIIGTHSCIGLLSGVGSHIRHNSIPEKYDVACIYMYATTADMTYITLPIDFSKKVNGNTATGWHEFKEEFAITPRYREYRKIKSDYNCAINAILFNKTFVVMTESGIFYMECPTENISYWCPEGDIGWEWVAFPSSNYFLAGGIIGMPVLCTSDGPVQLGDNTIFDCDFINTAESTDWSDGNPLFYGEIPEGIRGNCAPILICRHYTENMFEYRFAGRFGENMSIDSFNLADRVMNQETFDAYGGNTNQVKIYLNGELLCDDRSKFPWDIDWKEGEYRAEVSTDNILVDDEIPGTTTAVLTYNTKTWNKTLPTLTYLSFRNNEDKVTDRFSTSDDATVELYAADLKKGMNVFKETYFTADKIKEVKVEFAPMGSDKYQTVEMTEIPEKFYMPGYGYFFNGTLPKIKVASPNKWYDLRVTVSDEKGSSLSQVLSPAFRIESVPVESISLSHKEIDIEEGWSMTITATVNPDGTDAPVVWSTSDAGVATVSDGTILAIKEGECTVTAECGGKSATCNVKVSPANPENIPVTSLTVTPAEATITAGESLQLNGAVEPENATNKTLTWKSSDKTVATVDAEGMVKAIKEGTAVISATTNDGSAITAICTLNVDKDNGIDAILAEGGEVDVWTVSGQIVMARATAADLRSLASGIYILRSGSKTAKHIVRQ